MIEPSKTFSSKSRGAKSIDRYIPLFLMFACLILFVSMQLLQGADPLAHSTYNSYTLQALQWRKGEIALDRDYSYLELAIYQGEYYVCFPPVPTVPIYLLTFIWGEDVPDTLLIQVYAIAACLLMYFILKRKLASPVLAAVWAFLLCFASSLLPLLQDGSVWYQAQVLAFLLTVAAIERIQKGNLTAGLLFFALSVGCRPLNVLYGPLLIAFGMKEHLCNLKRKEMVVRLLPGILLGMGVATAYAVYNFIRFEDVFEFGYNYLPEYSTQGGIQFSIDHILPNASTFVWGLPFRKTENVLAIREFGFSMFLANPILLCLLLWVFRDLVKRKSTCFRASVFAVFTLHILILLSHRTCGSFQYGARYFIDCIPYVLLYMIASRENKEVEMSLGNTKTPWLEYMLLLGGLILNLYGFYDMHF